MTKIAQMQSFFPTFWTLSAEESKKLKFNHNNSAELLIAALYGTVAEHIYTIHHLMVEGHHAGTQIILRAVLEAAVDLENLCTDATYQQQMEYRHFKDVKALIEEGQRGNPFVKSLVSMPEAPAILADCDAGIAKFKAAGLKPITIKERFERVNMTDAYNAVYKAFCSETHNSITALVRRHLDFDNGTVSLKMFADLDQTTELMLFDQISDILLATSIIMHVYFKTGSVGLFHDMKTKLDAIRSQP